MTKQFDDAVQTLMVELLKHPLRTVRGDAVWQGVPVSPQDEVRLHLTLTNSGVAPIEVRNPAAGKDEDQIGLRLQLEKDLPIAKMGPADRIFIKAGRKEVSQISAPGAAPGAKPKRTVRLEPGEELKIEFVVMQHLFLSPGRYRAIIAYESDAAGIAEVRAVEGVLRVQTQILVVAEKAR